MVRYSIIIWDALRNSVLLVQFKKTLKSSMEECYF